MIAGNVIFPTPRTVRSTSDVCKKFRGVIAVIDDESEMSQLTEELLNFPQCFSQEDGKDQCDVLRSQRVNTPVSSSRGHAVLGRMVGRAQRGRLHQHGHGGAAQRQLVRALVTTHSARPIDENLGTLLSASKVLWLPKNVVK